MASCRHLQKVSFKCGCRRDGCLRRDRTAFSLLILLQTNLFAVKVSAYQKFSPALEINLPGRGIWKEKTNIISTCFWVLFCSFLLLYPIAALSLFIVIPIGRQRFACRRKVIEVQNCFVCVTGCYF